MDRGERSFGDARWKSVAQLPRHIDSRDDQPAGAIYWKLGAPPLAGQHAPYMLSNGHVLLFDNGPHHLDHSFPFSRVLEIDPATKEIVWKYQETRVSDFFSPRISNAQRLPNGKRLIKERESSVSEPP